MTKFIVTFIFLFLSFYSLSGKEPDASRVFPLVELKENELSQFIKEKIIPLAKRNHYDPKKDGIVLKVNRTDKGYKASIILSVCFYLYPVYNTDKDYSVAKIDGVLIFIEGNAAGRFYSNRLNYTRVYSKPLSLAVCDDEAQWTFVIEENSVELVSFEDWGLTWLEGVPQEFYNPLFRPIKRLEPYTPMSVPVVLPTLP